MAATSLRAARRMAVFKYGTKRRLWSRGVTSIGTTVGTWTPRLLPHEPRERPRRGMGQGAKLHDGILAGIQAARLGVWQVRSPLPNLMQVRASIIDCACPLLGSAGLS